MYFYFSNAFGNRILFYFGASSSFRLSAWADLVCCHLGCKRERKSKESILFYLNSREWHSWISVPYRCWIFDFFLMLNAFPWVSNKIKKGREVKPHLDACRLDQVQNYLWINQPTYELRKREQSACLSATCCTIHWSTIERVDRKIIYYYVVNLLCKGYYQTR